MTVFQNASHLLLPWLVGLALQLAVRTAFLIYEFEQWQIGCLGTPLPAAAYKRLYAPGVCILALWILIGLLAAMSAGTWVPLLKAGWGDLYLVSLSLSAALVTGIQTGINRFWPLPFRYPKGGTYEDPHGNLALTEAGDVGMP